MIDHTQLRANATQADITRLCNEAKRFHFYSVSIHPVWVSYCAKQLAGTGIGINPTVGFPLGANTAHVKVEEAREAIKNGATELDMVINIGALKSGFPSFVEREIAAVVKVAGNVPVKVILETAYLTTEEKISVCEMAMRTGASYVKTSTGFAGVGATMEDVALMRKVVDRRLGVKAAGGIRAFRDAMNMIEAGASRLGTSASVHILDEARQS
ncbi:MAG: deoxyribose-phosphate aldolase [Candidatus Hydrogenedentes bacterium]|nr:deoxyribose-phosphate aldolase [Candidatus Hydrogenedentota bacterium]